MMLPRTGFIMTPAWWLWKALISWLSGFLLSSRMEKQYCIISPLLGSTMPTIRSELDRWLEIVHCSVLCSGISEGCWMCTLCTAIPRCHRQYWIFLKQNKEELMIPPFTEDEFTRILTVAQWYLPVKSGMVFRACRYLIRSSWYFAQVDINLPSRSGYN